MPLLLPLVVLLLGSPLPPSPPCALSSAPAKAPAAKAAPPIPLAFGQMYDVLPDGFKPSAALLALSGKRVRVTGFMVNQEEPFPGGFTLCETPVFCDEEGGGDADIPPKSVRVVVRGLAGKPSPYTRLPLTVTGVLSVGRDVDAEGHVTFIRLLLDRPQDLPPSERIALRAMRRPGNSAPSQTATSPKGDY